HREVISELWAPAIFRKRILQVNRERLLQVGRERLIPFARLGENLLIANVKTKWHAANGQCDLLRCQRFPLCVWHRPWAGHHCPRRCASRERTPVFELSRACPVKCKDSRVPE